MKIFCISRKAICGLLFCVAAHNVSAAEPEIEIFAGASPMDTVAQDLIAEMESPDRQPSFSNLKRIYADSYTSVPAIRKSQAQLEIFKLEIKQKEAGLLPKVDLQTNAGGSSIDSGTSSGSGSSANVTVQVDQLLYDFETTQKEILIAESRLSSGLSRIAADRLEVLYEMLAAQIDLQAAKKMIVFHDANIKSRTKFYDLIKQKVDLGASSELDLSRARTKLLESRTRMPALTADLIRAEGRVKEFFGSVPEFSFAFYRLPNIAVNFQGDLDAVVLAHPSVAEVAKNVEIAGSEIEALRGAARGRISLKATHSRSREPTSSNTDSSRVYVEYANTVFDGYLHQTKIAMAVERKTEFEIELERMKRQIYQDLLAAVADYQSAKEAVDVRKDLLVSAQKNSKDMYISFVLNRATLTDVFASEEAYFSAAEGVVSSLAALQRAYYALLLDAGQLSDAFELNS
jgi:multidrug efflux system outer membrane protein